MRCRVNGRGGDIYIYIYIYIYLWGNILMSLKVQSEKRARLNCFDNEVSHRIGEWERFNLIT